MAPVTFIDRPSEFQVWPSDQFNDLSAPAVTFNATHTGHVYFRHGNDPQHLQSVNLLTSALGQNYRVQRTPGINGHCGLYAVFMSFRELCIDQGWRVPTFQEVRDFIVNLPPSYGQFIDQYVRLLPDPASFDAKEFTYRHYFSNSQLDLLALWLGKLNQRENTVVRIIYVIQGPNFATEHTFQPGIPGRPLNNGDHHIFIHYSPGNESKIKPVDDTETLKGWEHYSGIARRPHGIAATPELLQMSDAPDWTDKSKKYKFHGAKFARDEMLPYLVGRLNCHPWSKTPGQACRSFTAREYGSLAGLNHMQQQSIRKQVQLVTQRLQDSDMSQHLVDPKVAKRTKVKKADEDSPNATWNDIKSIAKALAESIKLPLNGLMRKNASDPSVSPPTQTPPQRSSQESVQVRLREGLREALQGHQEGTQGSVSATPSHHLSTTAESSSHHPESSDEREQVQGHTYLRPPPLPPLPSQVGTFGGAFQPQTPYNTPAGPYSSVVGGFGPNTPYFFSPSMTPNSYHHASAPTPDNNYNTGGTDTSGQSDLYEMIYTAPSGFSNTYQTAGPLSYPHAHPGGSQYIFPSAPYDTTGYQYDNHGQPAGGVIDPMLSQSGESGSAHSLQGESTTAVTAIPTSTPTAVAEEHTSTDESALLRSSPRAVAGTKRKAPPADEEEAEEEDDADETINEASVRRAYIRRRLNERSTKKPKRRRSW